MTRFDAIVIGAGPAGSSAALALARAGRSVAIVEKARFPRRKVCGEFISAQALQRLAHLGLTDVIASAGPEVRVAAVYAGERVAHAAMPALDGAMRYGRALGRDRLDAALLDAASAAGARVYQPWRVSACERTPDGWQCAIETQHESAVDGLSAPVVIAACGSWDTGGLAPDVRSTLARPGDLLAFKAHFRGASLPPERMPLLAFPGGYGGLVHADGGRVSFSCCIRRDALARCRSAAPGASAGEAVFAHVLRSCRGAREALHGGTREGDWLAVGPLRPGIRTLCGGGYFAVGNALGEAHPIVAEGISMAIQSAWLLSERLLAAPGASNAELDVIARDYEAAYRRNFVPRIRAAALFASLAMHPACARAAAALLARVPAVLAHSARWAGKARPLQPA